MEEKAFYNTNINTIPCIHATPGQGNTQKGKRRVTRPVSRFCGDHSHKELVYMREEQPVAKYTTKFINKLPSVEKLNFSIKNLAYDTQRSIVI